MPTVVDHEWPDGIERTDPDDRSGSGRYSAGIRQTKREIKKEMERMDVDEWSLVDQTGSGGDPGVVVRWTTDGVDYVACCDGYDHKKQNIRDVYTWINETRMREERLTQTKGENFAAAREALPSGEDDEPLVVGNDGLSVEPHEVLEVDPNASDEVVKAVARRKMANCHPDKNEDGDRIEYQRVQQAREMMLDE